MPVAKALPAGVAYSGRRSDAVVVNTTIDADAAEILRRYAPQGRKGMGKFLARLKNCKKFVTRNPKNFWM